MQANTPGAYAASLALHGVGAALVLLLTIWLARPPEVPPVIFELVAGPPTNPNATVAGATAEQLEVDLPKIKPLSPEVERPVEPVREEVVVPEPPPKPAPKKVETRKAEPVKKAEPKKAEPPKQVSYDQFVKEHGKPQPKQARASPPVRAPRINTADITRSLVKGGAGGTALTRPEQDLLANYIAQLIQALRLAHERPPGLSDDLVVQITFNIAANGDITNVRVARSSGYPEFDRSAVDAFRRVGSIGPTPNRRADTWTLRFKVDDDG